MIRYWYSVIYVETLNQNQKRRLNFKAPNLIQWITWSQPEISNLIRPVINFFNTQNLCDCFDKTVLHRLNTVSSKSATPTWFLRLVFSIDRLGYLEKVAVWKKDTLYCNSFGGFLGMLMCLWAGRLVFNCGAISLVCKLFFFQICRYARYICWYTR